MADLNNNSGSNDGTLLKAPENLLHPRDFVASATANDQSRGSVNTIQTLSEDQIFNNSSQGTGIAGPAVFGGPSGYTASKSSADAGTSVAGSDSVDLESGQNSCWNGGNAYSR